ncbi:MAG: hypothetical protein EXR07_09000 [Acetobacteraceae bacterium]|nr:hypothetical protein [Acetobacteraceae bacterium]
MCLTTKFPEKKPAFMRRLFVLLSLIIVTLPAHAGDLRIGRATEHGSLDPLYSDLGSDVATAENTFESTTVRSFPNEPFRSV